MIGIGVTVFGKQRFQLRYVRRVWFGLVFFFTSSLPNRRLSVVLRTLSTLDSQQPRAGYGVNKELGWVPSEMQHE